MGGNLRSHLGYFLHFVSGLKEDKGAMSPISKDNKLNTMFEYKFMHDGHPNCWEPYNMVSTGEFSTPGLTRYQLKIYNVGRY